MDGVTYASVVVHVSAVSCEPSPLSRQWCNVYILTDFTVIYYSPHHYYSSVPSTLPSLLSLLHLPYVEGVCGEGSH